MGKELGEQALQGPPKPHFAGQREDDEQQDDREADHDECDVQVKSPFVVSAHFKPARSGITDRQ